MGLLNKLKIRTRLYLVMGFALFSILSVSLYSLNTTKMVGDLVNQIKEHPLRVSNLAADSKRLITEILMVYQNAYIEMDPSQRDNYEKTIAAHEVELNANLSSIQELILGKEGQDLAAETVVNIQKWYNSNVDLMHRIYETNTDEVSSLYLSYTLQVDLQEIQDQLSAIQNYAKNKAEDMNKQAIELENKAQNKILVISISLVALLFGLTLMIARDISNSLKRLERTMSSSIEENQYLRVELAGNDEITSVSKGYNTLIEILEKQYNIRVGLNRLSSAISGNLEIKAITNKAISVLANFTNSGNGVLYLYNAEEKVLDLKASYAINESQKIMKQIGLGESLIGQVALDKKSILLENISQDEGMINTGLISKVPLNIIVMPLIFEEQLCGVIELASLEPYDALKIEYLEMAVETITVSIYAAIQKEKIHLLLDETRQNNALLEIKQQEVVKKSEELTDKNKILEELFEKSKRQAEDLQVQQEELRQNNEELEEQSRILKESEEKLQVQQEELKVTNEELEKHAKQLEEQKRIVDEKNKALAVTQSELVKKAADLEINNKYKSEFLANMSHELRTPLNSILVLSQLLMNSEIGTVLEEKEKEFARTIHSSGEDLLALINGILDLSKAEAGELKLQKEKVYLVDLLEKNKKLFETMVEQKSLEFEFSMDSDLPEYIESDEMKLNQILRNLISNAIKFTHEGSVNIHFRRLLDSEAEKLMTPVQDYIVIEISDTGIGIPEDKMEEIFEAFKQSDGTTSREYGGTGLGLTISLKLADLLGGKIIHESEERIGSKFSLILPIKLEDFENKRVDLQAIGRQEEPEASKADYEIGGEIIINSMNSSIIDGSERHILVIEEDLSFAKVISDLAEEKGYRVTSAQSGNEGIRLSKTLPFMGIILDMGLPDMDGMTLANKLSEDESTKNIPIHIISGSENLNGLSDLGERPKSIVGFLKKPLDIKDIYKTLSILESVDIRGVKQILVVGSCGNEPFEKFVQLGDFKIKKVLTGKEAFTELESNIYGCIILDVKLPDISGVEFMKALRESITVQTPIIIYTDENIDLSEIDEINRYAETIILKSQKSRDRLIDEVSLFLFDINRNFSAKVPLKSMMNEHQTLSGGRILLADDDDRNLFALVHLLKQEGMAVIVAKDGEEAVQKFKENDIDLVLMDIMMPKMDGFEAMKIIRESEKGHDVPIIALTAKAMIEDRDKCIRAGANDYLTKPIDTVKLLSLIKVWLS